MHRIVSLVAWPDRQNRFVFVRVPNERGRYVRTDRSVVEVACPACKTVVGEPCKGGYGRYWGGTHADRRRAAYKQRRQWECLEVKVEPDDIVDRNNDGANVTIKRDEECG